ncbi:MAG: endonuclease/exonuclease/phosphatase family protein [Ilumatobacter sp.]
MVAEGQEWSVLTWNIQGAKHTDLDRLAEVISAATIDVVVLQEVRRSQADGLAQRLSMQHTWAKKHHPSQPLFPDRAEGAAILTPHELSNAGHQRISDAQSKRSYRRRVIQWATVSRADATGYRVYNAHLSPHDATRERHNEARRISSIVAAHGSAPPAIIAGDLNDSNDPLVVATLPGIEAIASPATSPSEQPVQPLDHVLVPAAAAGVSVSAPAGGREWAELSDHLPLTVRFTLDWVSNGFGS